MQERRVIFYIANGVHLLDLAGMVQVFYEAQSYGKPYDIIFTADAVTAGSSAKLYFNNLIPVLSITPASSDIVVVAGFDLMTFTNSDTDALIPFLQKSYEAGAVICSVCTAAFALAKAGILNGKECTTHWKYTDQLQLQFPGIKVKKNRLFTKASTIYTSAGICTGIDLALFIMEELHGPRFAYQLAKELVVYIRRDGIESQESVYIQYRQHINNTIHEIQDWVIHNLDQSFTNEDLAAKAYTSVRNLTRTFKATTGITIGTYIENLRVEKALHLLKQGHKFSSIPQECGLKSAVQLRQLIKRRTGQLPAYWQ